MSGAATRRSLAPSAARTSSAGDLAAELWLPAADAVPGRDKSAQESRELARRMVPAAADLALVLAGSAAIFLLRFGLSQPVTPAGFRLAYFVRAFWGSSYPAFLLLYATLVVLGCMSQDLYRNARERSASAEFPGVAKAVGFATVLLVLFIFASGAKEISRLVVVCAGAWNLSALSGWRYAKRRYDLGRVQRGESVSRVLIVGAGRLGRALAGWFDANCHLGYRVCGFLDAHPSGDARVLGSVHDLRRVALGQFADQLFVTLPADREMVKQLVLEARSLRLNLSIVPDLYDGLGWRAPVTNLGGFPVIELHGEPIPVFGLAVKRAIDILGGAALLLLTAPLLAAAAIWIRCDSQGPAFYSALRVGKKGRKFRCYKLRTMVAEAEAQKDRLRQTNQRSGPFFKMENDPRVTRCGRFFRKYSIDELPQLLNVLGGDMSLVGPRPHPVDDFERYAVEHLRRLDVKPGVTGLWQVTARRDPSFDTNMVLDLEYIENWSLRSDLNILLRTVSVVLAGGGQ